MNTDILVIDDFLDDSYHQTLLSDLDSDMFPWYCIKNITHSSKNSEKDLGSIGFQFNICHKGQWSDTGMTKFLMPFCFKIKDLTRAKSVDRVRIDMTIYNPDNHRHSIHVDQRKPHFASVYYVNDSDGDTIIFNERDSRGREIPVDFSVKQRISPKANRLLIFDGSYYHTGHSPSQHKKRIIINSDLEK